MATQPDNVAAQGAANGPPATGAPAAAAPAQEPTPTPAQDTAAAAPEQAGCDEKVMVIPVVAPTQAQWASVTEVVQRQESGKLLKLVQLSYVSCEVDTVGRFWFVLSLATEVSFEVISC